jgi:hypothetical protein
MSEAVDTVPKPEGVFLDTKSSAALATVVVFGRNRTEPAAAASDIFCNLSLL